MSLPTQWASIHCNHGIVAISTDSGHRRTGYDQQGLDHFVKDGSSDEELGSALIASLTRSRVLTQEELTFFFDLKFREASYEAWIAKLLSVLGGVSRAKAFKGMKLCHARVTDEILELRPNRKERGEAWSGRDIPSEDYVSLPLASPSEAIGAAVREAISRCK